MIQKGTTPAEFYRRHKPRKGAPLTLEGQPAGKVDHVDGEIVFFTHPKGGSSCIIWCFREGLNTTLDWPTKSAPTDASEE